MITFQEGHKRLLFDALSLVCVSLFLYFYICRSKKQWYNYYWKGFFFLWGGCILVSFSLIIPLPAPLGLIRKIASIIFGFYGLYLLILGEKKKKSMRTA